MDGGDARRMAAVNDAWAVLSDPGRRAGYDATLRASTTAAPARPRDEATAHADDEPLSAQEADAARRLGCVLGLTAVLVAAVLLALFIYAFTRSGSLQP